MITTVRPRGAFTLAAAAGFLGGFTPAGRPDAAADRTLRLTFAVEGEWAPAGVAVTQEDDGTVLMEASGPADPGAAVAQATRMLSLDVDGSGLAEIGERDEVVAAALARNPGLRPVLFGSPYEAAVWAVLTQRVRMTQAAALRKALVARHGPVVTVAGRELGVFPAPAALIGLIHAGEISMGLAEVKLQRLQAVAEAALDGVLDATRLRALPPDDALAQLRAVPGLGVFSADLVLTRGAGHPDLFPSAEKRLHAVMAQASGLSAPSVADLAAIAEGWRPYRSWVSLLLRSEA